MTRWLSLLPLIVLAGLAVLFATYGLHHDPKFEPAALVGKPTPAIALPTLAGDPPQPLNSRVQGPTLINVFASWCVPCVEESPALLALKAQGVRIVGVAYEDGPNGPCTTSPPCDPASTRAFLEKFGNPFALVLTDQNGRGGVELGTSGVPETFLAAPDGRIVAKHIGPLQPKDAEALLEQAQKLAAVAR